jgi:hypothetical protein
MINPYLSSMLQPRRPMVDPRMGILSNLIARGYQPRQGGGPVEPGGRYVVGEQGPETLTMGPGGGGMVQPAGAEIGMQIQQVLMILIQLLMKAGIIQPPGGGAPPGAPGMGQPPAGPPPGMMPPGVR